MFNLISKKTIGTTGVTLALLVGGLLASPVSSAFAKPIGDDSLPRAMESEGYSGFSAWNAAQYPFFTSEENLSLAAYRRLEK